MELVRRQSPIERLAHRTNENEARKGLLKWLKNLVAKVLSFFRKNNRTIFMDDYEVAIYFMASEYFENVVRVGNGYMFCRFIGYPSESCVQKAMKPTRRDFTLMGDLVVVELLNSKKA